MKNFSLKNFAKENGAWLGFFILVLILSLMTQGDFLSFRNISNLARQASINGILAGGMTLIILTGGIDLSIGSVVALCGILVGISQVSWEWSSLGWMGALASLGLASIAGLAVGAFNGFLILKLRVAPFIITLGMMVIARGVALILSGGSGISPMGESLNTMTSEYLGFLPTALLSLLIFALLIFLTLRSFRRIAWICPSLGMIMFLVAFLGYKGWPFLVLFLAAVFLLLILLETRTIYGRSLFAIGSNERAAHWAGVPLSKVVLMTYALMGLLSGLAATLLSGRLNGADPNAGQLFELDAIASVVIGGTSLKGGSGSVLGSLVGALIIATLNNGMDLMQISSFYQMVGKGIIIIVAVALDRGKSS